MTSAPAALRFLRRFAGGGLPLVFFRCSSSPLEYSSIMSAGAGDANRGVIFWENRRYYVNVHFRFCGEGRGLITPKGLLGPVGGYLNLVNVYQA